MKYLNLNLDTTLGGDKTSDTAISSQKAIKTYVDTTIAGTSYTTDNPQLVPVEGQISWVVTHNLNTKNVICNVYQGDNEVEIDTETTSANSVTIKFKSTDTIAAETYTAVIVTSGGIGTSGGGGGGGEVVVDAALSTTSTNPVQNRVITNTLNNKLKGLKNPNSDYFSIEGDLEPDSDNILTIPEKSDSSKFLRVDLGNVDYDSIVLTYKMKFTTNFESGIKTMLSAYADTEEGYDTFNSGSSYLPTLEFSGAGYDGYRLYYPNIVYGFYGTFIQQGEWYTITVTLNKEQGTVGISILSADGTETFPGLNSPPSNYNKNSEDEIFWAIGRIASDDQRNNQPTTLIDLTTVVLTLDGAEHRMIDVDPYIEVDSLLVPEDIVDTGVAQLKQANSDDLGLVRVDEEFNEESDNVLPNYLIAPFGSRFIPSDTTYHVEADGSGDFETLQDAVGFLGGKWSNGTVNIELGEGNFDVFGPLNWGSSNTNIPNLHIFGQGINATTINVQPPEDDPSAEYDAFTIWGGTVYFENLTIFNDSENTTYRGITCEFGNMDGFGCDLIMQQVKVDGFGCNLWVNSLCRARLLECNIENYHERGIVAEGGDVKIEGTLTLRNVVKAEEEPAIDVYFGGRVTLYYPTIYTENITNLFGMDQEDFGKWRDNTGFIGGEYTQEDL